jgi:hypothetical protein
MAECFLTVNSSLASPECKAFYMGAYPTLSTVAYTLAAVYTMLGCIGVMGVCALARYLTGSAEWRRYGRASSAIHPAPAET